MSALPPTVTIDTTAICADVPVSGDDGALSCRLRILYRRDDPLLVRIAVQAPSGATVTDGLFLRADLAQCLTEPIVVGSIAAAPGDGRTVHLIFTEGAAHVGIVVPQDLIKDFLAATRALVGSDDRSEARACSMAAFNECSDVRSKTSL